MLFCSHSAFGQPSVNISYTIDPMAVDLGFPDVYWSMRNYGAENSTNESDHGGTSHFYSYKSLRSNTRSPNLTVVTYNGNSNWRLPTKDEALYLLANTTPTYEKQGVRLTRTINNKRISIFIPLSGYVNRLEIHERKGDLCLFWTSTPDGSKYAYRYKGYLTRPKTQNVSSGAVGDAEETSPWYKTKLPLRPVINKCKITVKIFEDNVEKKELLIERYVPKGTIIELSANGSCYNVNWVGDNLNSRNITIRRPIVQSETITAYFSTKTTNVKATTEDDQKGTVGILEPINN